MDLFDSLKSSLSHYFERYGFLVNQIKMVWPVVASSVGQWCGRDSGIWWWVREEGGKSLRGGKLEKAGFLACHVRAAGVGAGGVRPGGASYWAVG
jgi:hypothetical protein